jgi:F5/8 type C domain
VYVDLGASAAITQVVIYWDTAYATSYDVQTLNESGWTASSNADYGEDIPQNSITNAIDGTDATRFSIDQDQAAGLYYQVDLGSVQSFNAVDMDSGGYGSDYADAYTIAVSDNGTSWTTVTDGTGNQTPEVAAFPTQTAQYIRVTLDEASSANWWSIVDFSLLAQNAGWTASTDTSGNAAAAIDGNPGTRFTSGAAFTVQDAQYIKVTLTAPSTTTWWSIGESQVFNSQQ